MEKHCDIIERVMLFVKLNMSSSYTRNPLMEGFTEDYFENNDHVDNPFS